MRGIGHVGEGLGDAIETLTSMAFPFSTARAR
jgi:hypothetical protein